MRDSDTCFLAISSVMCTKYTQNICIDIENNVSLQDNSDNPRRIKSKWRYGIDETLNEIQSKPVPVIDVTPQNEEKDENTNM